MICTFFTIIFFYFYLCLLFPKTKLFLGPCEPKLAVKKVPKFFQQFYYLVQMGHTQSETDHYVIQQDPFTCTTCAKQDLEQDYKILLMTFAFNFIYQSAIQLKSIFGRRSEFSSWRLWNEVGIKMNHFSDKETQTFFRSECISAFE